MKARIIINNVATNGTFSKSFLLKLYRMGAEITVFSMEKRCLWKRITTTSKITREVDSCIMILTNCVDRYLLGDIQWSVDCLECPDRQYCDIELLIARRYP